MKKILKDTQGFTLLEAMVALMVLTIGLIGIAILQSASTNQNTLASHTTEATMAALDQIETILSWDADDDGLADNDNVNFQRKGILGAISAGNSMIKTVDDTADFQITTTDGYTIYYDGEPVVDPSDSSKNVAIDFRLFVVWNEGGDLKTVEMNFTKLLQTT